MFRDSNQPAAPPALGAEGRILEGVLTTIGGDGAPHIAPMGPIVDESMERLWLRPFRTSTTYENLKRTGRGVFHITDDVELIARAAVGQLQPAPELIPMPQGRGYIIAEACRWYALGVESLDDRDERTSIVAKVVDCGVLREFLGFNRAKHAVIEAAILATRVHLLDAAEIRSEFERLARPVDKTGSAAEHRAFLFLRGYVEAQLEAKIAGGLSPAKSN